MNKEFIMLDDGDALVKNENGNTVRRFCGNAFQKELLSENKKELIDNKISNIEKSLAEDKKVKLLSKWMLICQPFILALGVVGGFLIGGLSNPGNFLVNAIYQSLCGLFGAGIPVLISTVYWTIFSVVYKKKIKKNEIKLETIKGVKKSFEKENNQIKEHEYERRGACPNQSFSLVEDTQRIERDLDEIIDALYEDNLVVGLSLRKRK